MTLAVSSAASSPAMAGRIRSENLSLVLGVIDVLSAAPILLVEAGPGALSGRRKTVSQFSRAKVAAARNSTRKLTGA